MNEFIKIGLQADPGNLIKGFAEAEGAIAKFGQGVKATSALLRTAAQAMDAVESRIRSVARRVAAGGVGVSLAFGGMSAKASSFQREMLNVQSIARMSEGEFNRMSSSVINMSRALPQSATTIAQGLYDIQSSGFAGADALEVTEQAAIAAAAGLTQTSVSAKAITTVLNSYGLEAAAAADISDILFKTVDLGVISFEELAMGMGDWVGMAATVGVTADQGAAAIAAMTLAGINSAEASTSLARLMQSFIDPSEELTAVVRSLGYESALSMLQTEGLEATMSALTDAVGGQAQGFTALFPEIRAVRGAMALAANDGENYARVAGVITDENARAGAAMSAFQIQTQGFGAQWDLLKNNLTAAAIELGTKLLPVMTSITSGLAKLVGMFEKVPGPIKTIIAFLGAFAAVGTAVVGLLGLMVVKGLVFRFVMGQIASASAAAATGTGVYSRTLLGVSGAATRASTSNGILAASYRAVAASAGAASGMLGISIAGMLGGIGGVAALAAGVWMVKSANDAAYESGVRMARAYIDEFDTSNVEGLVESVEALRVEAQDAQDALDQESPWTVWDNSLLEATGRSQELNEELVRQEALLANIREAALGVFAVEVGGADPDILYPDLDKAPAAFAEMAAELGVTEQAVVGRMNAIAQAFEIDPNQHPLEYARDLREAYQSLGEVDSGGAERTMLAIEELGSTAATTTERIEGLSDVLDSMFAERFGLEEAVDNTQSSINDLFQTVKGFAEDGTLEQAMDPGSFHEDALTLRSDMRNLTQDYIDQSIAWAETQSNLTGGEFLSNLQDQADAFRQAATDAGVAAPVVERYASMIEDAAQDREIAIRFNESDMAAFQFVTDALIADLGLVPDEVETGMTIYKRDGEAALREWMEEMNIASNTNVENFVTVSTRDAMQELNTFAEARGLLLSDVTTIIKTSIQNPEDLDAVLADLALTDADYEALVEITGGPESELLIEMLNTQLTNLTNGEWEPTVSANEDPAMTAIKAVETELNRIDGTSATVTIFGRIQGGYQLDSMGNEIPVMTSRDANGSVNFANGGFKEHHYAQIVRPQADVRVWAEPETGGEAYIPLAPGKRRRSQAILMEVARQFGMQMSYANGGYWEYDPIQSKPVWVPYEQNPSTNNLGNRFRGSGGGGSTGGGGGSGGGVRAATSAAISGLDLIEKQYELGEISMEEYLRHLETTIKGYKKYSDEYMDLTKRIKSIQEDQLAFERNKNQIMLELNELSEDRYLSYLDRRIAAEEKYSDEWWDLTSERMDLEEQMADRQAGVESMMLELGLISEEQYKTMLKNRMATLRKFSQEWFAVWRELNSFNVDLVVDLEDAQRRYDDALQAQLDATEDYNRAVEEAVSDFRRQIQSELQAARDVVTGPIEALGNAVGQFGGELDTSRDEILEYYRHVTEGARRFQGVMGRLESAGLADSLLEQLYAAGPEALNVAAAFEEMVQTGQINELNSLANEIAHIADETADMYMSTRGQGIVDNFGLEPAVAWADDFGVSLDNVNLKAQQMASNFDGVKRALETVEAVAAEVAEALAALESTKIQKAEADKANEVQKEEIKVTETPVEKLYQELFGRKADAAGNAFWTARYAGGMSIDAIRETMKQSPEYLKMLYRKVLGREPDAAGFAFWNAQMQAGLDADDIERLFRESPEYQNRKEHGGFLAGGRTGWVGERGPELFRAPAGGAMIYPNGHGSAMGGDTVTIAKVEIGAGNNVTKADVRNEMKAAFKEMKRDMMTGSRR